MKRALCLPGCGCRGAFQFGVLARLWNAGERFDLVAGASSGSIAGGVFVAGLAPDGPDMYRAMASTPIVSTRYLKSDRSPFGMSTIVREALARFVPESKIEASATELLVSTTRARRFVAKFLDRAREKLRPKTTLDFDRYPFEIPSTVRALALSADALSVHSSRERRGMHDVIVASCTIPGLYAKLPRLDGEVHIDGGAADNTLLSVLLERGVTDITLVTPYREGACSPTLFEREQTPRVPPGVTLRLIWPEKTIRLRHFDFDPGRLEEALTMPLVERVVVGRDP